MTGSYDRLLVGVAVVTALFSGGGQAADLAKPIFKAPPIASWNWTGFYAGAHAGSAFSFADVSSPYGRSIYGDGLRMPGFVLGGQVGYNWQLAGSPWVFGIEGELSWLDADGSTTCFAPGGEFTSSTCSARPQYTGTLNGRVGLALGPGGRTLVYGKGGAAFMRARIDVTTNENFANTFTATHSSNTVWGWTLGAGIEQAITPAWSLKVEYDYRQFADVTMATPATVTTTDAGVSTPVPTSNTSLRQSMHAVKLGLNYHFGADARAAWRPGEEALAAVSPADWSFEIGGRYWYSSGRFQKDVPSEHTMSTNLASRLTYADMTGHSGEVFARLDTPWLVFVKGFAGLGRLTGGKMNDEDWAVQNPDNGLSGAYSNTLSNLAADNMNYQTIDVGLNLLNGPGYKVGPLVGYSRVYERYSSDNCVQIASTASGICGADAGSGPLITETDTWQSLRLGLAGDVWLTPRWRLSGDIAWLPYVKFTGTDNHWRRSLVAQESGTGRGVQMEAMVSYSVTPQFSLGLGARYWTMWTTAGSDIYDGALTDRSDTYRYERFGGLFQASYKFN